MIDENKIEYPYGWIAQGNRYMNLPINGNDAYAVECSEVSSTMDRCFPNWKELIDDGWRYYVLVYSIYDSEERGVVFLKDPYTAQILCEVCSCESNSILFAKGKLSCKIELEGL